MNIKCKMWRRGVMTMLLILSLCLKVQVAQAQPAIIATIPVEEGPQEMGINSRTHKIYVGHDSKCALSVLDGATNTLLKTLTLIDTPTAIAVNEVTNTVYVATGEQYLTVINGATDTITTVLSGLATFTEAVNVDAANNRVFVAATASENVYVVDGSSQSMLEQIRVGESDNPVAKDIAVNSNTNTIFVTLFGESKCLAIDGQTLQIKATIPIGDEPRGMALNTRTNTVYVACEKSGLFVINGDTLSVSAQWKLKASDGRDASAGEVAVNERTNQIFVCINAGYIQALDGTTGQTTGEVQTSFREMDVAVDKSTSRVYVSNYEASSITVLADNAPIWAQ